MHHGSRRFPARCVTAGVSAESAGVCKAPSVICGLGFHGLDFKRCLARLTSASSHTRAPKKRGVGSSLSKQLQPAPKHSLDSRLGVLSHLWRKAPRGFRERLGGLHSCPWRERHVMTTLGRSRREWGRRPVLGRPFSRGRQPGRERSPRTAI